MINKKERTIELYKLVGAEMRLFRTLGGNLTIHMSQVLLSTDTDKFMRVLQKIDEVRSRAEDNMFHGGCGSDGKGKGGSRCPF